MSFSLVPALFAAELLAIGYATHRAHAAGTLSASGTGIILGLLAALTAWGGLSTYLGITGAYQSARFLELQTPFWLPFVPVLLVLVPILLAAPVRRAVFGLIDHTGLTAITAFQALRILALGGIIKGWNGEFNQAFAFIVGVPDFLFGVSALLVAWAMWRGHVADWALAAWNLIGAAIIVPGTFIIIKLALPGPWQVFTAEPSIMTLYEFPMALAPTLVVPILVMLNLLVALRLALRHTRWAIA